MGGWWVVSNNYLSIIINVHITPAPLIGKYLPVVGLRLAYSAGAITMGLSYASFAFLHWIEDVSIFLAVSYTIRSVKIKYLQLFTMKYV